MPLPEKLKQNIEPEILEITRKMIKMRHDFHQHPEIAYEEDYAHSRITELLDEWELEYEISAKTGLIVTLEGAQNTSKKIIALRTDMDALCVHEKTDLPWKSRNEGKMHACGHDGHMATALTALCFLKDKPEFNGILKIIFQPAEEGRGGAKKMIEEGLIKNHKIGAVYGFHNWPSIPLGKAAIHTGPVMASSTNFHITLKGKGCHGAMPEQGHNPIPVIFELGREFEVIRNEKASLHPDEKIVLSICSVESGTSAAMNIIPGSSVMSGTMRTYNLDIKNDLIEQISAKTKEIEEKHGISANIMFPHSTAPTVNRLEKAQNSREVMTAILGEENIDWDAKPAMTAEDFGEYLSHIPGSYIWIGNGQADDLQSPNSQPLHNPGYDFNDDLIPIGAQYFVNIVKYEMPMPEGWSPENPVTLSRMEIFLNTVRNHITRIWTWLKQKFGGNNNS